MTNLISIENVLEQIRKTRFPMLSEKSPEWQRLKAWLIDGDIEEQLEELRRKRN
jgi:hypothetical protein